MFSRRIRWWRSEVENEKTVKQGVKNGPCERLWRQWCHLAIMQGHTSDSKCSSSAGIDSKATRRSKPNVPGQIQDHHTAKNSWCQAPVTKCQPRLRHQRFFGHFRPSVWLYSCSSFDFGLSPSNSTKNASTIRGYDFRVHFSLKKYAERRRIPFNNRVLRLPEIVLLNTTFRPGNSKNDCWKTKNSVVECNASENINTSFVEVLSLCHVWNLAL